MSNEEQKEEKQEPKAEAPKEQKPAEEKKEAKAAQPAAAPAAEAPAEEKLEKIARLSLHEVEAKIKTVQEKMGGLQSRYARSLVARRDELSRSKK